MFKWQTTLGIIVSSEIVEFTHKFQKQFEFEVQYTYDIFDKSYLGKQFNIGGSITQFATKENLKLAQELVQKYQPGNQITVFFNPNKHNEAVLETTSNEVVIICLFFGPIAFLAGALMRVYN